jgi:hypothetical protein
MDFSQHVLKSLTDDTWIREYSEKMGEDNLYKYKNDVYKHLYNIQVGQSISIEKWVKPENWDLFVKIACCFISESKGCYYFYENYTIIKHTFDEQQMERTFALFEKKRRENDHGGDGEHITGDSIRIAPVSTSPAVI